MVGSITSLGIGSGFDTQSIVDQLVAAEREPRELRLAREEAGLQAELSAFGALAGSVDRLGSAADGLRNLASSRAASLSSEGRVSVDLQSTAAIGNFTVTVERLAQAQTLASGSFADENSSVGTGSLTLSSGDTEVTVDVTDDNNSLRGIADAINSASDNITAQILNEGSGVRLLLTASDSGVANAIEVSVTDEDGNDADSAGLSQLAYSTGAQNLTQTVAPLDAQIQFNGLTVTSASNRFENVVDGVSLTAIEADASQPVTVAVTRDVSAAQDALSSLVQAFNSLSSGLRSQLAFDAETGQAGLLQGDATARTLDARISDALLEELGSGSLRNLVDIGVSRSLDGDITLDSAQLSAALETDFEGVASLLSAAAESVGGLAESFGGDTGIIGSRTESIQSQLAGLDERRLALEERLSATEARIRREFTGLDSLISQLQTTSDFLSTQLANLPLPGRDNNR